MFKHQLDKLETLDALITKLNDSEISVLERFLYERIKNPDSYVVFLGETSSGKSSIINGLLGETILPVKASPSTATITEVELSTDIAEDEYYAINKNATIERLDKATFRELCEQPDEELKRLKLKKRMTNQKLKNLRIFDTPGYGSIVKEHEEVLKDFLPNSDVIVYTIGYKIGIQDEDYSFMNFLKELVRDDVEVILLVNRCPEGCTANNPRIAEIKKYATAILNYEPQIVLVENMQLEEGAVYANPHSEELWTKVGHIVSSEEREKKLGEAFDSYIEELYMRCREVITQRYVSAQLDKESLKQCIKLQKETAERIREAIPKLIDPTFDKILTAIPGKLDRVVDMTRPQIESAIESSDKGKKDEFLGYTNHFLLPHVLKKETDDNVQSYIDMVLTDLNKNVDDYINKESINFKNQIKLIVETHTQVAAKKLGGDLAKEGIKGGLKSYFASFGGAAGANAGIANAASHLLKEAGGLVGKAFSRATHNALKHTLSKIGATSMRAVGAVVVVIVEIVIVIYDRMTWQGKLKESVSKGLEEWRKETLPEVIKDLNKLRETNIETIKEIAKEYEKSVEEIKQEDTSEIENLMAMSKDTGEKLGYNK